MWRYLAVLAVAGCAAPAEGPVAQSIAAAADEAGVPRDLLVAIAVEEGGLQLPAHRTVVADDPVPVAGALELRHGRLDTLALGASLLHVTQAALREDTALGTRAGALVVAQLAAQTGAQELASYRAALVQLAGMDDASSEAYAQRVLAIARAGGTFRAADGEAIALPAHPELPIERPSVPPPTPTPDYPDAIWFTTDCTDKCDVGRPLGNDSVDKIVIHDTEGGWDGSVATLQYDSGKSVHYIVDADGSRVGQFRPETDTTWHAGNYYYNETSIGIEHVGVASDPAGYSTGLYATSRALVQDIRTRWNIPLDRTHIVGHYQVPNGNLIAKDSPPCSDPINSCETDANYGGADNHRDPGYHWMWCEYMQALGGTCTCNDAYAHWNCTTDGTEAVRCVDGAVEIEMCTSCDVMPSGVDDDCHVVPMPDAMPAQLVDAGEPADNGGGGGGCAAGGADGGLALVLLALLRRRARRASFARRA
ncbi:MAG TPA: N-acetylmuramoyl-L-alanine amidase [Kofleriaceae bacterium]|jgi:N-acetyl-anhydromuramyl-L-alanine amidase AmpD